jgi:hypothetical protein
MADISIQFHALPEELRDFVKQCVADFGLRVVAIHYRPFEAVEVEGDRLNEPFLDSSTHRRLHFTLGTPTLPAANELDFGDKNPDALRLDIGERSKNELRESWLSARTENAAALAVWKKIAKRLKAMTEKGALAVNSKTGDTGPARGHRYTLGAKALQTSGVPMLDLGGVIIFKLGQAVDATTASE